MTLPNKLTFFRIALTPVFLLLFFLPDYVPSLTIASAVLLLLVYAVIELTDFLDGWVARKYNLVSDLGKVLDPYADVISRVSYFFCFLAFGLMPLGFLMIILYRELSITFLRMVMAQKGVAVAANIWGKLKSVFYAISAFYGILLVFILRLDLFPDIHETGRLIAFIVFGLAALFAVLSFATYLKAILKSAALKES